MGRAGIREDTIKEGEASEEENVEKAGPFNLLFFFLFALLLYCRLNVGGSRIPGFSPTSCGGLPFLSEIGGRRVI